MSIQALPASTAQLLRCSMNLTSPSDLIKELVDNSIDAKATAIEVSVSCNTIDRVVVKDNGTGIDIDDFNALGRRAHTSKLRVFEELSSIGGKSLGFRGEALASANSLANIVVITKKSRDPVAWRIELVHGVGGVQARQPVSATVGTTVAATKLFENMLPRRKHLLKEKSRTMSRIQDILKAYALARPHIRWSLKVVGSSKPTWSYSPASVASGREAILQLFGASLFEKCTEIERRIPQNSMLNSGTSSKSDDWVFSGYVGVQGSTSTCRQAVFISIDGRPMSSSWHISKKITNILKSHMTNIKEHSTTSSLTGHLFVQLSIQCPSMSYDPNITAQKDEVLLFDEKYILEKMEGIFCKALSQDLQCQPAMGPLTSSECEASATPRCEKSRELQSSHRCRSGVNYDTYPQTNNKNTETDQQYVVMRGEHHHGERSATKQPTIKAVLKTSFSVDMSKKEDDQPDDEDNSNIIEVKIPRRASPVQVDDHVRKDNIRHYFHPVQKQDFDIACDDTATTAETLATQNRRQLQLTYPPSPDRIPLKSLTASDLNRMRDEEESSPEHPTSDSIVPHIERSASNVYSAIESPPSQGRNDVVHHDSRTGGLRRSFQQPPVPIRRPQDNREAAIRAPMTGSSPIVLTPPPSDPRHRIDLDSPPLRPRLRLFDASPTPADATNRTNGRRSALASPASSSKQLERLFSRNSRYTGRQDTLTVPRLRSGGSRPSPGNLTDEVVTHNGEKPCDDFSNRNSTTLISKPAMKALMKFEPRPFLESSGELPSTIRKGSPAEETQGVPLGYSHASQINLARTPAPMHRFDAAASDVEDAEVKGKEHHNQTVHVEWAAELPNKAERGCSFPQASFGERNSAQRYGCSGLELSQRLLFRPEGVTSTQRLRTTMDIGHGEFERLTSLHAKVGKYELPGDIAVTLLSANLGGVQSVQRRLRWCVDSWMQRNKMRGEVDYTM